MPQEALMLTPRRRKGLPRQLKRAPRDPQDCPTGAQRQPQDGSNKPHESFSKKVAREASHVTAFLFLIVVLVFRPFDVS